MKYSKKAQKAKVERTLEAMMLCPDGVWRLLSEIPARNSSRECSVSVFGCENSKFMAI